MIMNGNKPKSEIGIWDWRRRRQIAVVPQVGAVHSLAFSPDGSLLAAAVIEGESGFIRMWETQSWKAIRTFRFQSQNPTCVRFSLDGQFLAAGGTGEEAVVWNTSLAAVANMLPGHDTGVAGLAFAPNRRELISAGVRGPVSIWDAATWELKQTISWKSEFANSPVGYEAIACSPDSAAFATVGPDQTLRTWRAAPSAVQSMCVYLRFAPRTVAYLVDGRTLVVGGGKSYDDPGRVEFFSVANGKQIRSVICPAGGVYFVQELPKCHCLAVGTRGPNASVEFWQLGELDL